MLKNTKNVSAEPKGGILRRIRNFLQKKSDSGIAGNHQTRPTGDQTHQDTKGRIWRLFQVESTLACNLSCIMCPWISYRAKVTHGGIMKHEIWDAIRPYLQYVQSVDFTGGGEPLLQPHLSEWLAEAKAFGCTVGLLTNGLLLNAEMTHKLLNAGIDWICFSIDSPEKEEYEKIRRGSDFSRVMQNIKYFSQKRPVGIKVMLNYVMMKSNFDQLTEMVRLAVELGVDQINFKQCEVIRGSHGKDFGLFQSEDSVEIIKRQRHLAYVLKLAKKKGLAATATPFLPAERCVCEQDPRDSLFIRYDGVVSPCINLANGGPTMFLGQEVELPHVAYGSLPQSDLDSMWQSDTCLTYRDTFSERCRLYDNVFMEGILGDSRLTPQKLEDIARRRMPKPPPGCAVCHYLYGL